MRLRLGSSLAGLIVAAIVGYSVAPADVQEQIRNIIPQTDSSAESAPAMQSAVSGEKSEEECPVGNVYGWDFERGKAAAEWICGYLENTGNSDDVVELQDIWAINTATGRQGNPIYHEAVIESLQLSESQIGDQYRDSQGYLSWEYLGVRFKDTGFQAQADKARNLRFIKSGKPVTAESVVIVTPEP